MVLLYGRAGRLTAENGGFRPGQCGYHGLPGGNASLGPYLGPPYGHLGPYANYSQWATYRYVAPAGDCHSIYRLLGSGPLDPANLQPYKTVGLLPPPDVYKEHPEWFWPRDGPLGNESQVYGREKQIGGSGGPLEPPGPLS